MTDDSQAAFTGPGRLETADQSCSHSFGSAAVVESLGLLGQDQSAARPVMMGEASLAQF